MPILYKLVYIAKDHARYDKLEFCHNCGSDELGFIDHNPNPNPTSHGRWFCHKCRCHVGCYEDGLPMGYIAPEDIRKLRREFHDAIIKLLRHGYTKVDLYNYVADRMGIERLHCHAGWFTYGELVIAIRTLTDRLKRPAKNRPHNVEHRAEVKFTRNSRSNNSRDYKYAKKQKPAYQRQHWINGYDN